MPLRFSSPPTPKTKTKKQKQHEKKTYKKNFESPLHTALINASRSAGVLATGLQNAKGLECQSSDVRKRW